MLRELLVLGWLIAEVVSAKICPRGYWPARVSTSSAERGLRRFTTDRFFKLLYGPEGNSPICQYCPDVGCYIVKFREAIDASTPKRRKYGRITTAAPITTSTTALFAVVVSTAEHGNVTTTVAPSGRQKVTFRMSCSGLNELPPPEDIITYLDCVQIGQADLFHLFIYQPNSVLSGIPPVDCTNINFLSWLPKDAQLLGLELGFPMKSPPQFLLQDHRNIFERTDQIVIDSSAFEDDAFIKAGNYHVTGTHPTQVIFRYNGLRRDRRPPPKFNNETDTDMEVLEECPYDDKGTPLVVKNMDCYISKQSPEEAKNDSREECHYKPDEAGQSSVGRKVDSLPPYVSTLLSMLLLVLVLLLTSGTLLWFCVQNRETARAFFLGSGGRKRKRELEEALVAQAAREAAEAERNVLGWNPFIGRYGVPPYGLFVGGYGPVAGATGSAGNTAQSNNPPNTTAATWPDSMRTAK